MSSAAESHRSGRLRLKKSKEERHHEYRHSDRDERSRRKEKRRKRREKEEEENYLKNASSKGRVNKDGPSRHPTALFGDDLLKAERYEAAMREEQSWSTKLNDLLHDDLQGGFGEFGGGVPSMGGAEGDVAWEEEMMRLRGDQFSGEVQQEIPKRWRDAAQGFQSKIGRGTAGLKEMDEEEYAEYIREGMYRRKHAKEIAFEEERQKVWEETQIKKAKVKEKKKLAKRKAKEAEEKELTEQILNSSRSNWENKWIEMVSQEAKKCRSFVDLPWPRLPDSDMTKESVHYFLFHNSEKQEASKRLRTALLRYHPDRFLSSRYFADIESIEEREKAKEEVGKVAKILSDIVNDRRTS